MMKKKVKPRKGLIIRCDHFRHDCLPVGVKKRWRSKSKEDIFCPSAARNRGGNWRKRDEDYSF